MCLLCGDLMSVSSALEIFRWQLGCENWIDVLFFGACRSFKKENIDKICLKTVKNAADDSLGFCELGKVFQWCEDSHVWKIFCVFDNV